MNKKDAYEKVVHIVKNGFKSSGSNYEELKKLVLDMQDMRDMLPDDVAAVLDIIMEG